MSSNKKIGILTFSYSSNPGSVLQAYSLQQTISGLEGYEAFMINYQKTQAGKPVIGKTVFMKPLKKWTIKNIVEWTARILAHPIRMYKYELFFNKYYNGYSKNGYTRANIDEFKNNYDAFVVGSDQVWNFNSYNVDYTYFLDFVPEGKGKISYAASFGQKGVPKHERENAKKFISDFDSISVREDCGVETVSELTGRTAEWVLDPSLLTDTSVYRNMAKKPSKDKYVFLYLREESKELEDFAHKLAKYYGLSVVKVVRHWMCGKNGKEKYALGPNEWLGYMDNAEYVITNSFHGICFSIIFEKEFFVDMLKGGVVSTNPRMESLLRQFNIFGRGICDVDDMSNLSKLDYDVINIERARGKEESMRYLKNALERSVNK